MRDDRPNRVTCTYEWSAHGVEPLAGSFANFNVKPFSDAWRDSFNERGVAKASAGEGLDLCGAERVVAVPVCAEGRRVGYGVVIDASEDMQADYVGLMRQSLAFAGVLLRKRNYANDRDRWNRRDSATGAQNRASLYAQARHLDRSEPLGLVELLTSTACGQSIAYGGSRQAMPPSRGWRRPCSSASALMTCSGSGTTSSSPGCRL